VVRVASGRGVGDGSAGALEAIEFGKRILIGAFSERDAALQAAENFIGGHERFAEGYGFGAAGAHGVVLPQVGFSAKESAQDPLAADERIDLETLLGSEGLEAGEVLVLELGELGAVFSGDELRLGVEPGFKGVHAGDGLALRSARAGGFFGVEAVSLDLTLSSHGFLSRPR